MSDQTDSGDVDQEPVASQAPVDSEPQPVSETQEGNSLAGKELVAAIQRDPEAQEELRRMFQSGKDKGVAKAVSMAEESASQVQRLAQLLNVDENTVVQAQRELVLDDMVRNYGSDVVQPVQEQVSSGLTVSEAQALASSALKGTSKEVQDAVLADVGTKAFVNADALHQYIVSQSLTHANKPAGSLATQSAPSAGEAKGDPSPEALLAEYTEKVFAARGKPDEIRALRDSYREQGLDVDRVVFTG